MLLDWLQTLPKRESGFPLKRLKALPSAFGDKRLIRMKRVLKFYCLAVAAGLSFTRMCVGSNLTYLKNRGCITNILQVCFQTSQSASQLSMMR